MNKQLRQRLEKTIQIAQSMLKEEEFHVSNSEIDCVPVPVTTKTAAKTKRWVLKRGAKRVGTWTFQIATGGKAHGDLYLETSFKREAV
ncbi:hypothetical protein [Marinobacterium stanieri]|uniref:Uncharacterized protein n=1 Tax=Marinobacterium stanieri TaxID=49186 RepID=A0A1N6QD71_9GAMM|nr:hypothetical protein [Marinobacterium stanieri]SIQ14550.1 hypothetical protein SAMN05421647_102430 [Marinobacterium stanieri]